MTLRADYFLSLNFQSNCTPTIALCSSPDLRLVHDQPCSVIALCLEWQLLHRDRQLDEREAGVALREQRVGGMDADLLATFGALPNGNSSASKEVSPSSNVTTHLTNTQKQGP